jgi:hypothetical protein
MATKEQAAARRITEIESRNQQQEEEIRTLRQRILQSDEKQVNMDRLLQARTADLKVQRSRNLPNDRGRILWCGNHDDGGILGRPIFQILAFKASWLRFKRLMERSPDTWHVHDHVRVGA